MVHYIINHLSVVSKHTQCDTNLDVIYVNQKKGPTVSQDLPNS